MKLQIVAVRDSAAGGFMRPFFVPSVGMAVRSFSDEVNRAAADNSMHNHPEDYELFHLGEFEEDSAVFTTIQPRSLSRAVDVKK